MSNSMILNSKCKDSVGWFMPSISYRLLMIFWVNMAIRGAWYCLVFVTVFILCGCTSIHIHGNGTVKTTSRWGITQINFDPNTSNATIVESRGLGIISTPRGVTLGWLSEVFAAVPEHSRCQVILWIENRTEVESILELLHKDEKSLNNICILNKSGELL